MALDDEGLEIEGVVHARLERARELMRNEQPAGWPEVSQGAVQRIRAVVRPAQSVEVWTDAGETTTRGSRVTVSSRVLLPLLRRRLESAEAAVDTLDLSLEDGRLVAVTVHLVAAFGVDLGALGARSRARLEDLLLDLLGPGSSVPVEVAVVDVVEGDPRVT